MKIPSCLVKSRHGVYYYRIQFTAEAKRKERRLSLSTKCPNLAKAKAIQISAIIARSKHSPSTAMAFSTKFDPLASPNLNDLLKNADQHQKFDIELPNGTVIRNINTPADIEGASRLIKDLNASVPQNLATVSQPTPSAATPSTIVGGTTIDEMIARFSTRKKESLEKKTQYEYGNYHRKFSQWIATRKNNKAFPIRLVTREDMAIYIDDLKANGGKNGKGLTNRTIQHKYLAAIAGLFELAQTAGVYPNGENPARGHKLFTGAEKKKVAHKTQYKPFTKDDLAAIFDPKKFLAQPKPDDYWLPLLGLFTGGRISELCQLAITDIQEIDGLWAISINDEDYKILKSDAARRVVPIHPQLIELGFLEYVETAKQYGDMIFPYLNADKYGKFSNTPSERFGDYLDTLGITDPRKVFHSFRKTSNNTLKQRGVPEETRCQYVGHEHDTTNSADYSEPHSLQYLADNVASKLTFEAIQIDKLAHPTGHFLPKLKALCINKSRHLKRKEREAALEKAKK